MNKSFKNIIAGMQHVQENLDGTLKGGFVQLGDSTGNFSLINRNTNKKCNKTSNLHCDNTKCLDSRNTDCSNDSCLITSGNYQYNNKGPLSSF